MSIKKVKEDAMKFYTNEIANKIKTKGTILHLCIYGSHLFGTASETSDLDIKGIYIPHKESLLLGEYDNVINIKGKDVDFEVWSIQYCKHLINKGDTNVFSVLYSQSYPDAVILSDPRFSLFFNNETIKRYLLHNKIKGIVRYCQDQAEVYVIKSNRINSLKTVDEFLKTQDPEAKLVSIWDILPEMEFAVKGFDNNNKLCKYTIGDRVFHETVRISYILNVLKIIISQYGKRSLTASNSLTGKDTKSISHAYRAAVEYISILENGYIKYPLERAETLKDIKYGRYDIDKAKIEIENMLNWINLKDDGSVFCRNEPDNDFINNVILSLYNN